MLKLTIVTLKHYVIGVTISCHQFWLAQERLRNLELRLSYTEILNSFIFAYQIKKHVKYAQEMIETCSCMSYERLDETICL